MASKRHTDEDTADCPPTESGATRESVECTARGPDIAYLSRLAALHFAGAELEQAQEDISRIIAMIETMQSVDTTSHEPLSHPLAGDQRLRQDKVSEYPDRADLQAGAPSVREGLYLVPRVLDES